jgi:1-deoxy-D-xylulose-5-phosphate synthase
VDRDCVAEFGGRCGLVVTLEDHVLAGGFGSAVMEELNDLELQVPVVRVGWPDAFIEHGKVESLRQKYGLTAEAALEKARPYLAKMMEHVLAKHS